MTSLILFLIILALSFWIVTLYYLLLKAKKERNECADYAIEKEDEIYNLRQDIRVLITVSPEQKKEVKQRWELKFREEFLFTNFKK